jgi:hypothetical protein
MALPYVERRPRYAPIWTEKRIRRDLRDYLAGSEAWPSREEFERESRTALRNAINRTGGPDRWATALKLPPKDRLSGNRRGWTHEAIEAQLKQVIGDSRLWSSRREFQWAGLYSMLTAIYRHEGPAYWAKRMNVELRPGVGQPRLPKWTEELIREERFCAGRAVFPTEREFLDAR